MLVDVQGPVSRQASPYLHLVVGCAEQYDALCGSNVIRTQVVASHSPLADRIAAMEMLECASLPSALRTALEMRVQAFIVYRNYWVVPCIARSRALCIYRNHWGIPCMTRSVEMQTLHDMFRAWFICWRHDVLRHEELDLAFIEVTDLAAEAYYNDL